MNAIPNQSGPGSSPGADEDEVPVLRPDPAAGAPVEEGAEELREEAAAARSAGAMDRADNPAAPDSAAEQARQTQALDPDRGETTPPED